MNVILTTQHIKLVSNLTFFLPFQSFFLSAVFNFINSFSSTVTQWWIFFFEEIIKYIVLQVNNAGVSFNDIRENSVEFAETVIKTNFHGAKLLTESLLPLFRLSPSISRILNISSRLGSINVSSYYFLYLYALLTLAWINDVILQKVRNHNIKATLQKERLSEEEIEGVVKMFLEDVKEGRWEREGWPQIWTDYSVSKLALNAYSRVLAKRFEGGRLSVNCFCPGYTQTSMTRGQGTHTPDAAAEVAVCLALLPPHELPTGHFFLGFGPYNQSRL